MNIERPDLSQVDSTIQAYIEALEAELERLRESDATADQLNATAAPLEPSEPPTTLNVITVSVAGIAKRTPRHHYYRQRRGGMGVVYLETPESEPPAFLTIADESQSLLLITNHARAFRVPVSELPESPLRSRGQLLTDRLPFRPEERLAIVLPSQATISPIRPAVRANSLGLSDWAPSERAHSGAGWVSMMRPSAPAASAARDSGSTSSTLPVAWLGSTTTGR